MSGPHHVADIVLYACPCIRLRPFPLGREAIAVCWQEGREFSHTALEFRTFLVVQRLMLKRLQERSGCRDKYEDIGADRHRRQLQVDSNGTASNHTPSDRAHYWGGASVDSPEYDRKVSQYGSFLGRVAGGWLVIK
jgi:hypothetical protein